MLLKNVHRFGLDNPPEGTEGQISAVMGEYEYWHYLCDSFDDRGWGCGYRTLQTIASWIISHFEEKTLPKVESWPRNSDLSKNLKQVLFPVFWTLSCFLSCISRPK